MCVNFDPDAHVIYASGFAFETGYDTHLLLHLNNLLPLSLTYLSLTTEGPILLLHADADASPLLHLRAGNGGARSPAHNSPSLPSRTRYCGEAECSRR